MSDLDASSRLASAIWACHERLPRAARIFCAFAGGVMRYSSKCLPTIDSRAHGVCAQRPNASRQAPAAQLIRIARARAHKRVHTRTRTLCAVRPTPPSSWQFQLYNTVLRRWPRSEYETLERGGNLFATTIQVLVSAVHKVLGPCARRREKRQAREACH